MTDATVAAMRAEGASLSQIVEALCQEKADLHSRILLLEQIAPHRYQHSDGTLLTWYPPEEAIPIERK